MIKNGEEKQVGKWLIVVLTVSFFLIASQYQMVIRSVSGLTGYEFSGTERLIFIYSFELVIIGVGTWIISRIVSGDFFLLLGLKASVGKAFIISVIATSPMWGGYAIFFPFDGSLTWYDIVKGSLLPGFTEELMFRGFLLGILFYVARIGFLPVILIISAIFGAAHLYQAQGIMEATGVFVITGLGSALFGWLYIEWDKNLWLPVFLHMLMNFSWSLYDTQVDSALGGWELNMFRFLTVAIIIYLTIRRLRKSEDNVSRLKGKTLVLTY